MLGKLAILIYALLVITAICGMLNPLFNFSTTLPWKTVNRVLVGLAMSESGILVILALIAIWRS